MTSAHNTQVPESVTSGMGEGRKPPRVTAYNVGRFVLSEDACNASGLDFRGYEQGVSDAADAFWMDPLNVHAAELLGALKEADWYIGQLEAIVYSADDTGTHESRAKVQAAIKRATA